MISENFYLSRYGFCPPQLHEPVPSDLKIIVVIPCFAEENLVRTLESFRSNADLNFSAEIIVVINASIVSDEKVKKKNESDFNSGMNWASVNHSDKLKFHLILKNDLPQKHAGVGLARKIGMDEAVFRFHQIGCDGVIVCADADAEYEMDFLQKVHQHFFSDYPKTPGCSIYFEHPLNGNEFESSVYDGILRYELFLRYYKNGLKYAGFPFAFHTIGSSMAVRSSAYQKSGGMNKRQAGEDFYFLQKIIELGNLTELNSTTVHPSPRPSQRVPFGTGRAISEWMQNENRDWPVYPVFIFDELKKMNGQLSELYSSNRDNFLNLHSLLNQFLAENGIESKIKEIRANSSSEDFFKKRFYQWMDAFLVLKATHFLRDGILGTTDIEVAAGELLKRMNMDFEPGLPSLIGNFRKLDRESGTIPGFGQKKIPHKVRD